MTQLSTVADDNVILKLWENINRGLLSLGIDHSLSESGRLSHLVAQAGFENASESEWRIPIGSWPRDQNLKLVGAFCQLMHLQGLDMIACTPLREGLKWTEEKIAAELTAVRDVLKGKIGHFQLYLPFRVVYAQKPFL